MRDFGVSSVTYYDLIRARLLERHPATIRALMMLFLVLLAGLALYLMYDLVSFASDPDHEVLLAGIGNRIGGEDAQMPTDGLAEGAGLAGANLSKADEGNSSVDMQSANLSKSNSSLFFKENNSSLNKSKKLAGYSSKKSHSSSSSSSSKHPINITDQNNISSPVPGANETASVPVDESGNNSNESRAKAPESWRDLLPSAVQDLINPEDAGSSIEPTPPIQLEGDFANQTQISGANETASVPVEETGSNSNEPQAKAPESWQDFLSSAVQDLINPEDVGSSGEPTETIKFGGDPSSGQGNEDTKEEQSVSSSERETAATRQAQKVQEIRSKQADVRAKQSEIQSKQADVRAKQSEIQSKQADVRAKQSAIQSKQADISAKQSAIQSKQADISAKQSAIQSKQADVSARQSEVGSGQSETSSRQSDVKARQSEAVARMKQKVAEMRAS